MRLESAEYRQEEGSQRETNQHGWEQGSLAADQRRPRARWGKYGVWSGELKGVTVD